MNTNFLKVGFAAALASLTFMACEKDDNKNDDDNTTVRTELYVTNGSNGDVKKYDMESDEQTTFRTTSTSSEGVYYDGDMDKMIVASRSSNQLNVYKDLMDITNNTIITTSFFGGSDLESPRDVAVNGNIVVVADNEDVDGDSNTADGRLFVYTKTDNSLTLRNTITTDFALWGIEFVGDDLYAVVDKTNMLAVYKDFAATNMTDATVMASKKIMIEGIVRTHGLTYDNGTMIMTDIGDAGSDSDGGFHMITDFDSKFEGVADGDMLAVMGNQVRVAGAATMMGNPVSVEYDADTKMVYVAEVANGGGRVLVFSNAEAGGDIAPAKNWDMAKANSLYLYKKK